MASKVILITGATDGIGREAAFRLAAARHRVLLHGRNSEKLASTAQALTARIAGAAVETYLADLSSMAEVAGLANAVASRHQRIDVLINNAGVLKTFNTTSPDGFDMRFAVNTFAPALLTRKLLHLIPPGGRVVNLSSAAQASVDVTALCAARPMDAMGAYSQSKLAFTIWSQALAREVGSRGIVSVAVNPGSMLATKMVKEGFGVAGNDISIGADIVVAAAVADSFAGASGQYFDNDARRFAPPHRDAQVPGKVAEVAGTIDRVVSRWM